jgi:uncharacterized membrane protein YhhN
LVIGLGGAIVAFFGCLGAVAGFSGTGGQVLGLLSGAVFVAGIVAFLLGAVLFVIAFFKAIFGKRDASPGPGPGEGQ